MCSILEVSRCNEAREILRWTIDNGDNDVRARLLIRFLERRFAGDLTEVNSHCVCGISSHPSVKVVAASPAKFRYNGDDLRLGDVNDFLDF